MTLLMLLGYLKKSWDVLLAILKLLWKYKTYVLIILTCLYIVFLRSEVSNSQLEKERLNSEYTAYKEDVEKKRVEALNKAKEQEIQILTKQKEVEVKYNEQINTLKNDLVIANNVNNSLHTTLSEARSRLSTATDTEARDYSNTATELLGECSGRVVYYATKAQEHRVNEERVVGMYNALVDVGIGSNGDVKEGSEESEVK